MYLSVYQSLISWPTEAIEAIITYSQDAEELLKRKKMHRDVIFKYLANEGVAMLPNSDKQQLIRRTIEYWSSGEVGIESESLNTMSKICLGGIMRRNQTKGQIKPILRSIKDLFFIFFLGS